MSLKQMKRTFPVKSELGSPEERDAKIAEMESRGFQVRRLYEYTKERSDYVATGYHAAKYRYNGSQGRRVYGVIFKVKDAE